MSRPRPVRLRLAVLIIALSSPAVSSPDLCSTTFSSSELPEKNSEVTQVEQELASLSGIYIKRGEDFVKISEALGIEEGEYETLVVIGKPIARLAHDSSQPHGPEDAFASFAKSDAARQSLELGSLAREGLARLGRIFPLPRDYEKPSRDEVTSAPRKVLIPGLITFSVQSYLQGSMIYVALPLTIVNAANSWVMGTWRKTFGNWFRRNITTPAGDPERNKRVGATITTARNLMITSFFTPVLYWSGRGDLNEFSAAILSLAGWQTLITEKWLSILFNVGWRTPTQAAVFHWEGEKFKAHDKQLSLETRRSAAATERMISYGMTQFYIASILSDSSLFKMIYDPISGLKILNSASEIGADQLLLLAPNIGHVAMASMGVLAATLMRRTATMDKIGIISLKFDNTEWALIKQLARPLSLASRALKSAWNLFRRNPMP